MSNKEEQVKTLDACIWGLSKYERAGSFQQAVQIRMIMLMIGTVREEIAHGTPMQGVMFSPEQLINEAQPSVEEVADQILKEINRE